MSIADAKVTWKFNLPISQFPQLNAFQGADIARDPNTGIDFLFQGQAHAVGPGEVEDMSWHRYRMDGADNPVYVDSMRINGCGHIQSHHARITSAGNPYITAGFEIFDSSNKRVRKEVRRCLYRAGVWDKNHPNFDKVFTGPGLNTDVVGNNVDFALVLRRARGDEDRIEWFDEDALLSYRSDEKYPVAKQTFEIPKPKTVTQTWGSIGGGTSASRAFRFTGLENEPSVVSEIRSGPKSPIVTSCNVTEYLAPGVALTAFEEPEILMIYQNLLYFGKQFNRGGPTRTVGYFSMSWTNP